MCWCIWLLTLFFCGTHTFPSIVGLLVHLSSRFVPPTHVLETSCVYKKQTLPMNSKSAAKCHSLVSFNSLFYFEYAVHFYYFSEHKSIVDRSVSKDYTNFPKFKMRFWSKKSADFYQIKCHRDMTTFSVFVAVAHINKVILDD